jgi:hypothetical protein
VNALSHRIILKLLIIDMYQGRHTWHVPNECPNQIRRTLTCPSTRHYPNSAYVYISSSYTRHVCFEQDCARIYASKYGVRAMQVLWRLPAPEACTLSLKPDPEGCRVPYFVKCPRQQSPHALIARRAPGQTSYPRHNRCQHPQTSRCSWKGSP